MAKARTNCKDCGIELDFTNSVYAGIRRVSKCKECYRNHMNEWRKEHRKNPEILQKHKDDMRQRYYKTTYNITEDEYNKLVEFQQGGCAICRLPCSTHDRLSVDHNHITGEVRGLLCQKCNTAIAMVNEDEDLIFKMIEYLKRTTWNRKIA